MKRGRDKLILRSIMLILVSFVLLTKMGCKTYQNDPEIQEFLTVDIPPSFPIFSQDNPELKEMLKSLNNTYSWILTLLSQIEESGDFYHESTDKAITIYTGRIDWIEEIINKSEP